MTEIPETDKELERLMLYQRIFTSFDNRVSLIINEIRLLIKPIQKMMEAGFSFGIDPSKDIEASLEMIKSEVDDLLLA